MKFTEIIAQEGLKKQLRNLVDKNRLSHALLFLGKEGAGGLPISLAFAQYVLCEQVQVAQSQSSLFDEDGQPLADSCGVCSSCLKVEKLIHPDLHFSYPVMKRNTKHEKPVSTDYLLSWREFIARQPYGNVRDWLAFLKESPKANIESAVNKQGNIGVSECDDIIRKLSLKSFENKYKVLIMWMPEFLGPTGNRLLKLIEEPPANTLFIFVANDESEILQTILSRTQLVRVPVLSIGDVSQELIKREVPQEKAVQVAALSGGNFGEALKMVESEPENWEKMIRQWLNVIYKRSVPGQMKWIEVAADLGRERQKQLLTYFTHLLEQAVQVRYLPEDSLASVAREEIDFGRRINQMCGPEAQEAIVNELEKAIYYIERNANSKLLFHALTIKLYYIIKDNSLILVN